VRRRGGAQWGGEDERGAQSACGAVCVPVCVPVCLVLCLFALLRFACASGVRASRTCGQAAHIGQVRLVTVAERTASSSMESGRQNKSPVAVTPPSPSAKVIEGCP
jgi:hypothetical protein